MKKELTKSEKIGMSIVEIAKAIRKDFKEEFGKDIKFSVRSSTFSGGRSIDVTIKRVARKFYMNKEEFDAKFGKYNDINSFEYDPDYYGRIFRRYSKGGDYIFIKEDIIKKIREIIDFYNFDESDVMVDYFYVNFYSNISGYDIEVF